MQLSVAQWESAARRAGVPSDYWPLMKAITWVESRWDPNAVGAAGEVGLGCPGLDRIGLAQILPATAEGYAVPIETLYDPSINIGTAFRLVTDLSRMFAHLPQDVVVQEVLSAYNCGINNGRSRCWNGSGYSNAAYVNSVLQKVPEMDTLGKPPQAPETWLADLIYQAPTGWSSTPKQSGVSGVLGVVILAAVAAFVWAAGS